jgi:hypothetical protein
MNRDKTNLLKGVLFVLLGSLCILRVFPDIGLGGNIGEICLVGIGFGHILKYFNIK